jgi:hypothetical protein
VNRPTIPDSAVPSPADDVLTTDFGGEMVLLNLRDGVYYGLDAVGSRIWALLQQAVSVAGIREAIAAEYDVDPARCERDIQSLLSDLAVKGLVELRGGV